MKNKYLYILLSMMLLLAGCSGNSNSYDLFENSAGSSTSDSGSSGFAQEQGSAEEAADESTVLGLSEDDFEKKIIRDAYLTIRSEDVSETYRKILEFAGAKGGYEFSHSEYQYNDSAVIEAQIKIIPQNLDLFIAFIKENAELVNSRINSEDITDQYYDASIRLDTLRRTLDKYYELLAGTKSIEEMLLVQERIDRLTLDIEAYEGKVKMWDRLAGESTVTISISKTVLLIEQREIKWSTLSLDDMLYLLKKGFLGALNILVSTLQWLVIALVSASPVLAVIVTALIILKRKKRWIFKEKAKDDNKDFVLNGTKKAGKVERKSLSTIDFESAKADMGYKDELKNKEE